MKKIFILITSLSLLQQAAKAQTVEFSVGLSGNITAFGGSGAAETTSIYISDVSGLPNYSGAAFGKKPGLGWGAEATVQRVGKSGFITGLGATYEILASKADITQAGARIMVPADGSVRLSYQFINLFPYAGKRLIDSKQKLDVNVGLDVALPLSAHEKAAATTSNETVKTDADRTKPKTDLRPRVQLSWQYHHIGIQGSFAFGTINAYDNLVGADLKAYANVGRLGLFYRF